MLIIPISTDFIRFIFVNMSIYKKQYTRTCKSSNLVQEIQFTIKKYKWFFNKKFKRNKFFFKINQGQVKVCNNHGLIDNY